MRENFSVQGNLNQWLAISKEALVKLGARQVIQDPRYARLSAKFQGNRYIILNMRRKEQGRLLFEFEASDTEIISAFKSAAAKIFRKLKAAEKAKSEKSYAQERLAQIERQRQRSQNQYLIEEKQAEIRAEKPALASLEATKVIGEAQATRPVNAEPVTKTDIRPAKLSFSEEKPKTLHPEPEDKLQEEVIEETLYTPGNAFAAESESYASANPYAEDAYQEPEPVGEDTMSFTEMYDPDEFDFIEQTQMIQNAKLGGTPSKKREGKFGELLDLFESYCRKTWFMVLLCLILPPIGIFMLWYQKQHQLAARIGITLIAFLYMILFWAQIFGVDTGINKNSIGELLTDLKTSVTEPFTKSDESSQEPVVAPTDRTNADDLDTDSNTGTQTPSESEDSSSSFMDSLKEIGDTISDAFSGLFN